MASSQFETDKKLMLLLIAPDDSENGIFKEKV